MVALLPMSSLSQYFVKSIWGRYLSYKFFYIIWSWSCQASVRHLFYFFKQSALFKLRARFVIFVDIISDFPTLLQLFSCCHQGGPRARWGIIFLRLCSSSNQNNVIGYEECVVLLFPQCGVPSLALKNYILYSMYQ